MLDSNDLRGFTQLCRLPGHRRVGAVDVADVVVGVALLCIVPLLTFVVASSFREGSVALPTDDTRVEAPLSSTEIGMRLEEAQNLLTTNAKNTFMKYRDIVDDPILREHYRRWAELSLSACLSKLDEVNSYVRQYPDGAVRFRQVLSRSGQLRSEAEPLLQKMRSLKTSPGGS